MKARLSILATASLVFLGCSDEIAKPFMPLDDDIVDLDVWGSNLPIDIDGVEYLVSAAACIADPAFYSTECGIRKNPTEEFHWDSFAAETGGTQKPMSCTPWVEPDPGSTTIAASCKAFFEHGDADQQFRFTVNEYQNSVVTMPPMPTATSPSEAMEVSVSSGEGISISWEPSNADDELAWKLRYFEEGDRPHYDDCASGKNLDGELSGDIDDTGHLLIESGTLPTNLPVDGCPVVAVLTRTRSGQLDPGIKSGSIRAHQQYGLRITLKP